MPRASPPCRRSALAYLGPSLCHRGNTCTKAVGRCSAPHGRQQCHWPRLLPGERRTYRGLELAYPAPSLCHRANTCTKAFGPHSAPHGRHKASRCRRQPRVCRPTYRRSALAHLGPSLCHRANTRTKALVPILGLMEDSNTTGPGYCRGAYHTDVRNSRVWRPVCGIGGIRVPNLLVPVLIHVEDIKISHLNLLFRQNGRLANCGESVLSEHLSLARLLAARLA